MFTRKSMFALAALAVTAASIMASPALAGGHSTSAARLVISTCGWPILIHRFSFPLSRLSLAECSDRRSRSYAKMPGGCIKKNVGQVDTIDTGDSGRTWQEINGNLPGKGAYGN